MLTAFRRDGRMELVRADPRHPVWIVREVEPSAPSFEPVDEARCSSFTPLKSREVVLRREVLVHPCDVYGPLENLGFEPVAGRRYDRRIEFWWDMMNTAWLMGLIGRCRFFDCEHYLQYFLLVFLVFIDACDEALFGPLWWFESVVFVEEGSRFYERFR